ncbi:MAG: Gfo/Idh/MocA family oxidoreductase [Calditrichaeota bacterium]|nr:Gfo/Idh/MocA family oxidoreductase [Calditrichota bacterium]
MEKDFNRREFIGLGTAAAAGLIIGCSTSPKRVLEVPPFLDQAPDGMEIRAGLIGCGGRGSGAAINFLNAGPNLKITALGDVFQDKIDEMRKKLKDEKNMEVADANCFVGFDAFQKVLESDVNMVILATPPHFRPEHFAAAVNAKKHVFMEKPVAVDPVGARSVIASSKKAEALGLCVGTGTQRRHQRDYVATFKQVYEGAIGKIVSATCYWNQSQLWYREPRKEWSEMEYMIRDWVNWKWLSGDHIVEQHVHNIDVINWFTEKHPLSAVAFGGRHRRVTGDQYDHFSTDFIYDGDIHVHSMCRQINNCADNVSEYVRGTEGYTNCSNTIYNLDGSVKWQYQYPLDEEGKSTGSVKISPYDQEHIDLVTAIRKNKPYVEAEATAVSTLAAIMARISAYTGKEMTWEEMMSSDLQLKPKEYKLGAVDVDKAIPVPGTV